MLNTEVLVNESFGLLKDEVDQVGIPLIFSGTHSCEIWICRLNVEVWRPMRIGTEFTDANSGRRHRHS